MPAVAVAAVARNEPARISAKAATTSAVRGSERNVTPAATATAGLTYVKTTARVGPASRISSRKTTKASAVQITPRPARDRSVGVSGTVPGHVAAAAGA
ncbi:MULTISPECIES: hypothetical protein [unclassified Streptomyces]|uniref:hypothetical protein n=1 Tax=Streptomyces sp. 135 TaxID=2838850 RepID=UPI0021D7EEA8|nr:MULTISPECIES: hypothetical protein [unclassified Streptomyces]WPO74117.1 hypothetical protein R9806_27625 [Streptomyces sp. KN37]